jgi:hypothetical protein
MLDLYDTKVLGKNVYWALKSSLLFGSIKKNFTPKVIAIAKPIHKSMWIAIIVPKKTIAKCNAK